MINVGYIIFLIVMIFLGIAFVIGGIALIDEIGSQLSGFIAGIGILTVIISLIFLFKEAETNQNFYYKEFSRTIEKVSVNYIIEDDSTTIREIIWEDKDGNKIIYREENKND